MVHGRVTSKIGCTGNERWFANGIVLPGQMNNDGMDCYEIELGKLAIVVLRRGGDERDKNTANFCLRREQCV